MKKILYILFPILLFINSFGSEKEDKKYINKLAPDDIGMLVKFNRITLPIFETGMIGNRISGSASAGLIDTNRFLYSSGFFISGINEKKEVWANGVYPSGRINAYFPGTVKRPNVYSLFFVSQKSEPFGPEWQLWKDAVKLGAEFYDGDNDGYYDPVDKNDNGVWDFDEDKPAIYGDVMSWSAYHDGAIDATQGINIRQTIWSQKGIPDLDKVIFIKYSLENTGFVSLKQDSVIFSIVADPDLGFYGNDLVGSNVNINEVFTYDQWNDPYLNEESVSFITTLVQGPIIEKMGYRSYRLESEDLNSITEFDEVNNPIISTHSINRFINSSDPEGVRSKMLGYDNSDPCSDNNSTVYKLDCDSINSLFEYSGNPIKKEGWVNTRNGDQQYLMTTGQFSLDAGETQDIIFAFVVGTGEDGTQALLDGQRISKKVRYTYFDKPWMIPNVDAKTITYDNTIEIVWETPQQIYYSPSGYGYRLNFEGYEVCMYDSPLIQNMVDNTLNKKVIARYDVQNKVSRILIEDEIDYNNELVYKEGIQLNPSIYGNEETGRVILKINWDPFNNEPLRKGKPYYISITPFALNKETLIEYDSRGSYLVPSNTHFGYYSNEPIIINDNKGNSGIVIGENLNDPFFRGVPIEHVAGESEVEITYSIYDEESVTDDSYQLFFTKNELNPIYQLFFSIQNITSGEYLMQNQPFVDDFNNIQNLKDGFVINLGWEEPGTISYSFEGNDKWFNNFDNLKSGIYYVGKDIEEKQKVFPVSLKQSTAISVDKLKRVELHFADTSKAYRYVRRAVRYLWHGSDNIDSGYVNIPVSAYTIDRNGNSKKISIAFLENAFPNDSLGRPDGRWNPGADISGSKEYLAIFDTDYSDDPYKHLAYTGQGNRASDIAHGYTDNQFPDSIKNVARSPWFDAMYIIGFETHDNQAQFEPTGIFSIEPAKILTPQDKYMWKVKKEKNLDERRAQFEKINVYPNPLFGYNSNSNAFGFGQDEPFITFSNLPEITDIMIYTLSGTLIRTIYKNDSSASCRWDLKNDSGGRIASGMYIAIVEVPEFGKKVLKIGIIQPQKRVHFK